MTEQATGRISLGEVEPAGSRHMGRRSAILATHDRIVLGTADGTLHAIDSHDHAVEWTADVTETGAIVSLADHPEGIVVGARDHAGTVQLRDPASGDIRWQYDAATDVGPAQKDSRFFLPFIVAIAVGPHVYVAARRYERINGERQFQSVIYAVTPAGDIAWRFETDASPISIDADDERVAVAYNRCPGTHQHGLVVLDTATGHKRMEWDPGTTGDRRVGDVSLLDTGCVVTSHGDYHGYRLESDGSECWQTPLATPVSKPADTVYAYPNHVHATPEGVVFVTGNTYPETGRQTSARHPHEHTVFGYTPDGKQAWTANIGGFATEIGTDQNRVAIPTAQNFRERTPDTHGLQVVDITAGPIYRQSLDGIGTAATLHNGTLAVVEEPLVYHDEGRAHGTYQALIRSLTPVEDSKSLAHS